MSITTKQHIAAVQLDALKPMRDELNEEIARLERILSGIDDDFQLPTVGTFTAELTSALHDILAAERPLKRPVILDRLAEKGVHVGGKDSLRTLSAYLSNDDRFESVIGARGMWTLAQEPALDESTINDDVEEGHLSDPQPDSLPPELMEPWPRFG